MKMNAIKTKIIRIEYIINHWMSAKKKKELNKWNSIDSYAPQLHKTVKVKMKYKQK